MNSAGRHLIIDAVLTKESRPIVTSTSKMAEYLEKVSDITGMTLVFPPIAVKFPFAGETHRLINNLIKEGTTSPVIEEFKQHIQQRNTQGSGVSAMSMWLESHCTLHTWPEYDYISIDLFSCKTYEYDYLLEFTKNYMQLRGGHVLVVDRFMNMPASVKRLVIEDAF